MPKSTTQRRSRKANSDRPPKPYDDFPLTPHPAGYWCKSINGKIHYFGRWGKVRNGKMERVEEDGWRAALEKYQEQRDDLYAGRQPRQSTGELTVSDLCNRFLTAKVRRLDNGEIVPRTFHDYKRMTDLLISFLGKSRPVNDLGPDDFEALRKDISTNRGPVSQRGMINVVKMVFKHAYDNGLIDNPIRYGSEFKSPSKSVLRKHRIRKGLRMFEANQIRALINAAPLQLKAMTLLAVNCGFGNNDCGTLPIVALDLNAGWIDYPRPKTAIARRCPLWSETIEALQSVLEDRPTPKSNEDSHLVFITKYGKRWAKNTSTNPISAEFRKLLKQVKDPSSSHSGTNAPTIYRKGVGFYALRHTFETIGGESRDQPAVDLIMGHADASMAAVYRERISDERLRAVTDTIHAWLFPAEQPALRVVG